MAGIPQKCIGLLIETCWCLLGKRCLLPNGVPPPIEFGRQRHLICGLMLDIFETHVESQFEQQEDVQLSPPPSSWTKQNLT